MSSGLAETSENLSNKYEEIMKLVDTNAAYDLGSLETPGAEGWDGFKAIIINLEIGDKLIKLVDRLMIGGFSLPRAENRPTVLVVLKGKGEDWIHFSLGVDDDIREVKDILEIVRKVRCGDFGNNIYLFSDGTVECENVSKEIAFEVIFSLF